MDREIDKSCAVQRHTAPMLDSILGYAFPVLDHGFVRVVDYMGNDSSIVEAARVSYGDGTKTVREDQGLINYLMRHWHTTPFEMCEIKLHVKLPVFVARQWIRHRTANVNEYSARYSILEKEFYMPEPEHLAVQATDNKQGRGEVLSAEDSVLVLDMLRRDALRCYDTYETLIDQDQGFGLARELARMNLPVNIYTQWYWKTDLHNLFHFLRLRMDPHAQYEIRAYADIIGSAVKDWVPMAAEAFEKYQLNSLNLSELEMRLVGHMLAGSYTDGMQTGMSKGEATEFMEKINLMVETRNDE